MPALLPAAGKPAKPFDKAQGKRPNVILVMTDDQGYGDLGCHGNKVIRTPHLDKLHKQSIRLTDFHVAPCCTPTRTQLMTGRDAVRTGAWGTTWGRSLPRPDEVMLAEVFKAGGYRTGMFGKWHLGDNYPYRPEDRGFEEVLRHGGGGVGQSPDFWGNDYFDDTYCHNGTWKKHKGYCTDVWFDGAMSFIEANKDRPFFAYLSTNAPHSPYLVAEKYKKLYAGKKNVPNAAFYGMITNIDENMGRLIKKLKDLGLEDNTILIFLTDNGTSAGVGGRGGRAAVGFNAGMRGKKGSFYEGGHRVPCFIRWPDGQLVGPGDTRIMTCCQDLMPTLITLCGLKAPAGVVFDGMDVSELLRKTPLVDWPDRTLIVQYSQTTAPPPKARATVMTQQWRLVGGKELYDILADPGQRKNVAAANPDIVQRLRAHYEEWWRKVSRRFDDVSHIVIGSDRENPSCLTGFDWLGARQRNPWNQGHVRSGHVANGYWAVQVERDGTYEIALRRWPAHVNKPIVAAIGGGRAIKATKARLKIADVDQTIDIAADTAAATFRLKLKAGKTRLQTWLIDDKSKASRGAYFVYVKRLS